MLAPPRKEEEEAREEEEAFLLVALLLLLLHSIRRQAARAHRRFRARFEPQRLFERARVYELLASLNRKARQAEGTRTAAPAEPSAPAPRVTTNLAPCTVDTTKPTP